MAGTAVGVRKRKSTLRAFFEAIGLVFLVLFGSVLALYLVLAFLGR